MPSFLGFGFYVHKFLPLLIILVGFCMFFIFLIVLKRKLKFDDFKKKSFFFFSLFIILLLLFELILTLVGHFYFYIHPLLSPLSVEEKIDGGAFRILFLGESTTTGSGVVSRDAYSAQVEKILQQKYPDKKIKSYNRGFCGIGTPVIFKNLDKNIAKYRPHLVILMAGYNDNFFVSDDKRVSLESFYSQFKVYRLIVALKDVIKISLQNITLKGMDFKEVVYLYRPIYNPRSKVVFNLVSIIDKVRSYGSDIWFVGYLQPNARDLVNPVLEEVAEENDIVYVGDYPVVDFVVNRSLFVDDGWHPSEEGHKIIAEKIAEKIIGEGVIENRLTNTENRLIKMTV